MTSDADEEHVRRGDMREIRHDIARGRQGEAMPDPSTGAVCLTSSSLEPEGACRPLYMDTGDEIRVKREERIVKFGCRRGADASLGENTDGHPRCLRSDAPTAHQAPAQDHQSRQQRELMDVLHRNTELLKKVDKLCSSVSRAAISAEEQRAAAEYHAARVKYCEFIARNRSSYRPSEAHSTVAAPSGRPNSTKEAARRPSARESTVAPEEKASTSAPPVSRTPPPLRPSPLVSIDSGAVCVRSAILESLLAVLLSRRHEERLELSGADNSLFSFSDEADAEDLYSSALDWYRRDGAATGEGAGGGDEEAKWLVLARECTTQALFLAVSRTIAVPAPSRSADDEDESEIGPSATEPMLPLKTLLGSDDDFKRRLQEDLRRQLGASSRKMLNILCSFLRRMHDDVTTKVFGLEDAVAALGAAIVDAQLPLDGAGGPMALSGHGAAGSLDEYVMTMRTRSAAALAHFCGAPYPVIVHAVPKEQRHEASADDDMCRSSSPSGRRSSRFEDVGSPPRKRAGRLSSLHTVTLDDPVAAEGAGGSGSEENSMVMGIRAHNAYKTLNRSRMPPSLDGMQNEHSSSPGHREAGDLPPVAALASRGGSRYEVTELQDELISVAGKHEDKSVASNAGACMGEGVAGPRPREAATSVPERIIISHREAPVGATMADTTSKPDGSSCDTNCERSAGFHNECGADTARDPVSIRLNNGGDLDQPGGRVSVQAQGRLSSIISRALDDFGTEGDVDGGASRENHWNQSTMESREGISGARLLDGDDEFDF